MSKRKIKFANRIREYREDNGITMKQLAIRIVKTKSSVSHIERTRSFPRGETREKIMKFLDVNFNDIFYEGKE